MSHLHRFYARHAARVWQLEGNWLAATGTFRSPAAIQWMATGACDLACNHCYSASGHRLPDELDTEEALALVDEIAALGTETLVIAGGEPLIRRDLDRVVAHAVASGLQWSLHTHGGLVMRRRALFEQFPPSLVAVSLDGPRRVHEQLRGPGSFARAVGAIRFLRTETKTRQVIAGTTVNRTNADALADMVPTVIASQAHAWGLHLFAPEGRGAEHRELLPTPTQLRRVAAFTRRMRRVMDVDLDNEWGSAGDLDPFYRDQPFLCGAGRFTAVIAANGDMMPCTTTDPSESEGNVRTHSLGEVWRSGFRRFRSHGDRSCSDGADCWLQTRNGNSCRADAFGIEPEPLRVPDVAPPKPRAGSTGGRDLRLLAIAALASAAPAFAQSPPDAAFPDSINAERWLSSRPELFEGASLSSGWGRMRTSSLLNATPVVARGLELTAAMLGKSHATPAELIAALDEAEGQDVWDPWLVVQVWQRSGNGPRAEVVELYARLERHARVVDALVLAAAETGPITFLPWRKKSSAPQDYQAVRISTDLVAVAKQRFPTLDGGTWRNEATIELTLTSGTATLYREGVATPIAVGSTIRLARFDLVELSGRLTHQGLGVVASIDPPTSIASRWLPGQLSREARARAQAWAGEGLRGDPEAIDQLGSVLPAVHLQLQEAIISAPEAEGAPALRQLLLLFEE